MLRIDWRRGAVLLRLFVCASAATLLGSGCGLASLDADVNLDGYVDSDDLSIISSCLFTRSGDRPGCGRADVDRSGLVDFVDLVFVASRQGEVLFDPRPPRAGSDGVVLGDDRVLYFLRSIDRQIERYSLVKRRSLSPLAIGAGAIRIAHGGEPARLYVGYADRRITRFDSRIPAGEIDHATATVDIRALTVAGPYVAVANDSYVTTHAEDGSRVGSRPLAATGSSLVWHEDTRRLYRESAYAHRVIGWVEMDPATGRLVHDDTLGTSPSTSPIGPLHVGPDARRFVLGSGDMFFGALPVPFRAHPGPHVDATFLGPRDLFLLSASPGGAAVKWVRDDDTVFDVVEYEGTPLAVFSMSPLVLVLTEIGGEVSIRWHIPDVDVDDDGAPNDDDAFPLDPAASADRDGDGWPDAWNPGRDATDSTTGLVLDAFPENSACQIAAQARSDDPLHCDIAGQVPPYDPDAIVADGRGIVYLLSGASGRIFRWSSVLEEHLDPFLVRSVAGHMAYSPENDRLYLAYADGDIVQIDALEPVPGETPFSFLERSVGRLASAGRFVYAADSVMQATFASDGTGIDTRREPAGAARYYLDWSAGDGRIYELPDTASPRPIHWTAIDTTTGVITSAGEASPPVYWGRGPLRPSPDGAWLFVATGEIYDTSTLEIAYIVPETSSDGLWLDDGTLVTVRDGGDGHTVLERWQVGVPSRVLDRTDFAGLPLRILDAGPHVVVVTSVAGAPAFATYSPSDDRDGDGVRNQTDAFPLDPAASLDTDGDGAPDAWNQGMGAADSTTGLTLDAFPFDSACQIAQHSRPGQPSVCDIAGRVPAYVPRSVVADSEGVVHLLSPENDRIFRWSVSLHDHLNPIIVGDDPAYLAWSEEHDALYVAYATGAISRIDLNATFPAETPFAATPGSVLGLQTAAPFLFAIGAGIGGTHYIFDEDGAMRSAIHHSRVSQPLAWNPALDRMYMFQSLLPNDLMWEHVDPQTGEIDANGESPYHGDFSIEPPIRVSPDGGRILLGAGEIYDAETLTVVGALSAPVTDVVWLPDGSLVTIRDHGDGRTRLERLGPDLAIVDAQLLDGVPLHVLFTGGDVVVVTDSGSGPVFTVYGGTVDGDADGVPYDDDAFPLDPAAATDTDLDGAPDAWLAGRGPGDSTLNLVLDAFPLDGGCQSIEHGSGGFCDLQDVLPTDVGDRFCDVDSLVPGGSTGQVMLGRPADFIPLCDGWVLLADTEGRRIRAMNAVVGRDGPAFELPGRPRDLELDEQAMRLYVALPDQLALGIVDLLTGDVEIVPLGMRISGISLAPDGAFVFGRTGPFSNTLLHWLAADSTTLEGPWPVDASDAWYNAPRGELLTGRIRRYSFDPISGPIEVDTSALQVNERLSVSPDGSLIATVGYRWGYRLLVFDAADLSHIVAEPSIGRYEGVSAAFDPSGALVVAATPFELIVFETSSYQEAGRMTVENCSPASPYDYLYQVEFSRGGRIVLGLQWCGGWSGEEAAMTWFTP